jgi:hypothetical protein
VFEKVNAAGLVDDWKEVLKWEGRLEEMMANQTDANCSSLLKAFARSHTMGFNSTGNDEHALSAVRLEIRRVEVLGKMQRFRDQGEALCKIAAHLRLLDNQQEAKGYFQRGRKIAEAHGFFSVECNACLGLGGLATEEGRQEEGVELLRNALVCVPLCEEENPALELNVLHFFTDALFDTHAIDEVEPLVARYLDAAKAESEKQGRLHMSEFHSLFSSARLHEVMCSYPPRWKPLHTARPLHVTKADSVSHRY